MEQTLILVKPDGVERGLVGEIITRLENKGLKLKAMKLMQMDEETVAKHYAEHLEKPFFPDLKAFVMRSPIVAPISPRETSIALSPPMTIAAASGTRHGRGACCSRRASPSARSSIRAPSG